MKCIITAGPTYEELDEVRRLTNFSSGRLGSELADYLLAQGHEVHLLLGHYATWHGGHVTRQAEIFTTTDDLSRRLQALAPTQPDALFHAAAVSDFTFGAVWVRSSLGELRPVRSRKISTRHSKLLAELVPTPKIIAQLRSWFPQACIVGWKYEVEGARERVIAKSIRQISDNKTNACVANGRAYGPGFGLVTRSGECLHAPGMTALFRALEQFASNRRPI